MKNIFRRRTEDELDLMKDEGIKLLIDILKILAINVLATWMAVLVVVIIYGTKSLTPNGRIEIRESLDLNFILAYFFMLVMTACVILMSRSKFTYGDPVAEWNAGKLRLFLRNAAAYVVINIPVGLYFLICDIASVYSNANTTSGQSGIAKLNTAESLWIANFFAPQATFYRLTRSIILGILINVALYVGFTAIFYLVIKMKPPKNTNNYRVPVVEDNSPNDDMNAVD